MLGGGGIEAVNNLSNRTGWAERLLTTGATLLEGPEKLLTTR